MSLFLLNCFLLHECEKLGQIRGDEFKPLPLRILEAVKIGIISIL